MFDKAIIDTDRFMDLPVSAKALYFLLGMEADDEGFVSYKKVIRIHGGNDDDIKVLAGKEFVILFKSGVVVIVDWNKNNYLDKNRIRETEYLTEKENIHMQKDRTYMLNDGLTPVKQALRQNRIEQDRIGENSIEESDVPSPELPQFIDLFKNVNPSYGRLFNNKTERAAAERLLKQHTYEKLEPLMNALPGIISQPYAPRITTPWELEKSFGKLILFVEQEKNKKTANARLSI